MPRPVRYICVLLRKRKDEKKCRKLIKPVVKELKKRFGRNVFATEESKTLEEAVVDLLKENEMTLSLAESCTGGAVASRIVGVSGASEVLMCGFVTYTNRAKRKCLGVKKSTLHTEGAVSAKCAREMAKGGCKAAKTDVCSICYWSGRPRRWNGRNTGRHCVYGMLL